MQVRFYSVGGSIIIPSASNVTLKIYRPDNSLFQTVSGLDIHVEADGLTWAYVSIGESEMTGAWVAEWLYNDPVSGRSYKVEMPFLVSDVAYR